MKTRGQINESTSWLPVPVRKAIDAVNTADIEAFLALFTPDSGYVKDWGREFRGIEAIRFWSNREFIGKHVKIHMATSYVTEEGDIVVVGDVGGFGFKSPNAFAFQVDGELLANLRTTRF